MRTSIPRKRMAVALAVGCLLVLAGRARAETLLRWKFTPGDTLRYVATQEMNQKMQMPDPATPVTMTMTMTADYLWTIRAVDPSGVATTEQSVERMQMKMQGPQGGLIDYDSASGKEPEGMAKMLAPVYSAMVKKAFVLKITPRGEVLETRAPPGLLEAMKKLPGADQMGDMLTEGFKKYAAMIVFPEQPVDKGQSWTRKTEVKAPMFGTLATNFKYQYLGPENRGGAELEKIGVMMGMATGGEKKDTMLKFKKNESEGALFFDNVRGRLVETAMKLKMQTEINMLGKQMVQDFEGTMGLKLQPAAGASPQPKP
jgi:hypothetical protein